jgi:hypothetical protein
MSEEIVEFGILKAIHFLDGSNLDLLEQTNSRKLLDLIFSDFQKLILREIKIKEMLLKPMAEKEVFSLEEINKPLDQQGLNKNVDIVEGDILSLLDLYLDKNCI